MPQLLLMRHGKTAQADSLADRERPLTPRGRRDCEMIAPAIARDYRPDRILCSPALRTRETLAALLPGIGEVSDITFLEELYDHPGDYTDVLAANGRRSERLLVIGHNPAVQETAVTLIGSGDSRVRAFIHEKFPTSAVAVIAFDGAWARLEPLSGRLVAFLTPRGRASD
jgi:phosphohistidine phosphatase